MNSRPLEAGRKMHRNLRPHKAAVVAMYLYGSQYSAQGGGSMDFWDSLPPSQKRVCYEMLERLKSAPAMR